MIASSLRIEKGLDNLTQNQESLERIMELKFHDLDVKLTEIQSVVEQLSGYVYAKKKMGHNTMAHMYKEIPDKSLETFSFGSVHFLLSGLPTINCILRHTIAQVW